MEQRPWLKNYPPGVPANIHTGQYENLVQFFDESFSKYKNLTAFECFGTRLTYGEVDKLSRNFAAYLHSRGLNPGDKIALMMPNLLQYPVAIFGALRAGLIVVNTNPLYTPREMLFQFNDSEVKAIVILENFASHLEKIINQSNILTVILTSVGEMHGFIKSRVVNFVVRNVKRMVPKYNLPNTVKFSHALNEGARFQIKSFNNCPEDVIIHQYTGGTTGISKGAMLTNQSVISNMLQIKAWMQHHLIEGKEITLSPLPMYHIFAFTVNCLAMILVGAHTVLVTNARDIKSVIKEFRKNRITLMTGINTLFNALVNNEDFKSCDFSGLKITVGGGMAIQKTVADKWKDITGCVLTEGYGMTESSPLLTVNPLDGTGKQGSIGMPVSSTDMLIVNEDGKPVEIGETGEIIAKGPQIMKGYYNQPGETARTVIGEWLHTGDIGRMDEEGYFYIVDRKKDMILVSGFNVFPNEIEDVVMMHPDVLEVAAIGIPDEKSGEVVKLFVVPKTKSLSKQNLIKHCKENLTGYKVPKVIEFRTELPKTNVGKILRRALRDEA